MYYIKFEFNCHNGFCEKYDFDGSYSNLLLTISRVNNEGPGVDQAPRL